MLSITQQIANHKHAYENCALDVPPFRLTCKEHLELVKILSSAHPESKKATRVLMYLGVPLEIVTCVEDYC